MRLPVSHRAGLNTTHGSVGVPCACTPRWSLCHDDDDDDKMILVVFFHLLFMLLLGWLLFLTLPASADAGGASLLSRRLCRVFSPAPVLLL